MFLEDYLYTKEYRNQGEESSNKIALKERLEKIKGLLAEYYECSEEEIVCNDIRFADTELTQIPYKVILGDADFSNSKIKNVGILEFIGGDAKFTHSEITSLCKIQTITGSADFRNSQVNNLGVLCNVGGNAWFSNSKIKDLLNLQSIGGDADFRNSQVNDLGVLCNIGGTAWFSNSKIQDLLNLQSIGGSADFRDSQVNNLGALCNIGENAWFSNSKIQDLLNLQSIGGDADFSYSSVTSLGSLRNIDGNAIFDESPIVYIENLSIKGDCDFCQQDKKRNSKIKNFLEICKKKEISREDVPTLVGVLSTSWRDKMIDGILESNKEILAEYYNCREDELYIGDVDLSKHDTWPYKIILGNAYFGGAYNSGSVPNLQNLLYIMGNADLSECLDDFDLGGIQCIEGSANFFRCELSSLGKLRRIGGNVNFNDCFIEDLGDLEDIDGEIYWGPVESNDLRKQYEERQTEKLRRQQAELIKIGQRQRQGDFREFVNGVPSIDTVIESEGLETEVRGDE